MLLEGGCVCVGRGMLIATICDVHEQKEHLDSGQLTHTVFYRLRPANCQLSNFHCWRVFFCMLCPFNFRSIL